MFKETKSKVINCLRTGLFQHEARNLINEKNLLKTGEVSVDTVIKLISKTKGFQYIKEEHHMIKGVDIHIFKIEGWYIKFYFVDPNTMFISVHE